MDICQSSSALNVYEKTVAIRDAYQEWGRNIANMAGAKYAIERFNRDIGVAPFPHKWGRRVDAINRVPTLHLVGISF